MFKCGMWKSDTNEQTLPRGGMPEKNTIFRAIKNTTGNGLWIERDNEVYQEFVYVKGNKSVINSWKDQHYISSTL